MATLSPTQSQPPPMVHGVPLLGIAWQLRRDPLARFVELYHQYGEIFRTKLLLNRDITVLAGMDANQFLHHQEDAVLTSEPLFGGFGDELNTDTFLVALDGEEHRHLRKNMRRGYSRSAMTPHLDTLIQQVDEFTQSLKAGDTFALLPTMQYLVTQQLGIVIADRTPDEYFSDLQLFLNRLLFVKVLRVAPPLLLKLPDYQRAKRRLFELSHQVLDHHRQKSTDAPQNLIDDLLTATDPHGNPYRDDVLLAAVVGPYLAGIDTVASSISFLIYNILHYPEIHSAIRDEVMNLFSGDTPSIHAFGKLDMLHGTTIENLRMYPVAPFTPRTAKTDFEFKGYPIRAGEEIFFAQTVTHYLPEFYPDPLRFDPTRFAKGQGKGDVGAFAPYTLGAHLCLGAGIAETQMMLITARLFHNLDLELAQPDEPLTIYASPLPNVGRKLRLKVIGKRY